MVRLYRSDPRRRAHHHRADRHGVGSGARHGVPRRARPAVPLLRAAGARHRLYRVLPRHIDLRAALLGVFRAALRRHHADTDAGGRAGARPQCRRLCGRGRPRGDPIDRRGAI